VAGKRNNAEDQRKRTPWWKSIKRLRDHSKPEIADRQREKNIKWFRDKGKRGSLTTTLKREQSRWSDSRGKKSQEYKGVREDKKKKKKKNNTSSRG